MPLPALTTYLEDEAACIKAYTWSAADETAAQAFLPKVLAGSSPFSKWSCARAIALGCASVLDIGCGLGEQYDAFAKWAPKVAYTGCDVSPFFVERARARLPGATIAQVEQFWSLPFKDGAFDMVMIRSALGYYGPENGTKILDEALRVAKVALAVHLPVMPGENKEPVAYTNHHGSARGYTIQWPQAAWDKWLAGKHYSWERAGGLDLLVVAV